MPYLNVNDMRQYYQDYGPPGGEPVVLVHGWMGTGESDWTSKPVFAQLSARYRCIVPDCRGHGRTNNPTRDYRFARLGADVAGLIRGLELETAHVLGFSNGGNVAVVTLLEHPEAVRSAVLYAANAFVDDSLRAVSAHCQPEVQETRSPAWCAELAERHATVYGPDYWRELMRWSATEIGLAPNYRPEELARARRPALVIQGENDGVNARGHHAEFIAEHVPGAELWIAAGCGHSVHEEVPDEFARRVMEFWERHAEL